MLEVRQLAAGYGRAQVLHGMDFSLRAGEAVALLGRNGAGKSTTLKAVMGLLSPTAGSIHLDGARIDLLPPHRHALLGLGYVPEDRRIFGDLTVEENLEVGRQPPRQDAPHWTQARLFELFPNLARHRRRPGGSLSGGEQQMLSVARTLRGNPRIVLLDEPFEGLAPLLVERMAEALRALKAEGLGLLLSEQNLRFAGLMAERALLLDQGRLRYDGSLAALAADESLRARHLAV